MRLLNNKDCTKFNDQKVINYMIEECNNNYNIILYTHVLVAFKNAKFIKQLTESTQYQTKHSYHQSLSSWMDRLV